MSSFPSPQFSIITATLNRVATLEKTILSVLNQDYPHKELWVIDGGSTDGTLELLEKYASHPSLHWISEPDSGIYDALNKGIQRCLGNWVGVLHSGDVYCDGILSKVAVAVEAQSFDVYLGAHYWSFPHQSILASSEPSQMKQGLPICHQAVFYQKALHASLGLYDLKYSMAADFDFLLKALEHASFHVTSEPVCFYEMGGVSDQAYLKYAQQVQDICLQQGWPAWKPQWHYVQKWCRYQIRQMLQHSFLSPLLYWYKRRR